MRSEIIGLERQVWEALVQGDAAADRALLHPDFIGVYSDGFADRGGHTGQLSDGPTVRTYELSEIEVKSLGVEHALICYRAEFQRVRHDATEVMYVSSIWRKGPDGWANVFSQDTAAA